jgi:apolipoprotein D and lipocalin family protein
VWGDYQVIALAPDYSHAMVGTPDRKYLWILSRSPRLDPSVYELLIARAAEQGFEVSRIARTSQSG